MLSFVVVQPLSHVRLFVIPWTAACQASLSFSISRSLLKLISIVWDCGKPNKFNKTICEQSPGPLVGKSLELQ